MTTSNTFPDEASALAAVTSDYAWVAHEYPPDFPGDDSSTVYAVHGLTFHHGEGRRHERNECAAEIYTDCFGGCEWGVLYYPTHNHDLDYYLEGLPDSATEGRTATLAEAIAACSAALDALEAIPTVTRPKRILGLAERYA